MKTVAIIMAGGKGERLWPMSTPECPKQFLKLVDSERSMVQLTLKRIEGLLEQDDIYVVALEEHKELVYKQLHDFPKENIILLPEARNTAPLIAYMTIFLKQKYDDANVIVLASDHHISNTTLFLDNLHQGICSLKDDSIVTLGIVPSRVETGYGYIQMGNQNEDKSSYQVERFVEKPNYEVAKQYCESGDFLWNSGMFLWRNNHIYDCFQKYAPHIFEYMKEMLAVRGNIEEWNRSYLNMEQISIDYAIMEKAQDIAVIPGSFGWDDVGSWLSVERLKNSDVNNNIVEGSIYMVNGENNIIVNDDSNFTLALVGIHDQVVVKSGNSLLVMAKDDSASIKKVLEKIRN